MDEPIDKPEEGLTEVGQITEAAIHLDPPIQIRPSPAFQFTGLVLRQLGLVGGAVSTLLALRNAHDTKGLFDYIASSDFLIVVGIVMGIAVTAYGWFRELKIWKKFIVMEKWVPDEVAHLTNAKPDETKSS